MKRTAASSNRRIDNADRFDRLFDTSIETRLRRASCKPGPALVQTDERCVTASVGSRVLCSSELNLASESSSSALGGVPRQVHGCEAYPVTEDLREWHLDLHPTAGPLEGVRFHLVVHFPAPSAEAAQRGSALLQRAPCVYRVFRVCKTLVGVQGVVCVLVGVEVFFFPSHALRRPVLMAFKSHPYSGNLRQIIFSCIQLRTR